MPQPVDHISQGGSFLILSDVSLRKEHECKLETAAYIDSLTQILNRSYLIDCFDRPEDRLRRLIAVIDIDRFRLIHSRLGSRAADQVLIGVGGQEVSLQIIAGMQHLTISQVVSVSCFMKQGARSNEQKNKAVIKPSYLEKPYGMMPARALSSSKIS